jgi:chromate reductase
MLMVRDLHTSLVMDRGGLDGYIGHGNDAPANGRIEKEWDDCFANNTSITTVATVATLQTEIRMTSTLEIAGIAGSLRSASWSRIVLESVADLLPDGATMHPIDIGSLPHYNEDVEHGALPTAVSTSRERVHASDAVIIVTPEFNHGLPGVLKNTLDWLSRPAFSSCMVGKPVFFITLSPGALGGVRAQYQLRETLSSMLCRLIALPEIAVTHVGAKIENGELTDTATRDYIGHQLKRFLKNISSPVAH